MEELQYYLAKAKKAYSLALKNLEDISEEIHEMRRSRDSLDVLLDKREQGVGAETPSEQSLCGSSSITRETCSSSSLSSISTSESDQTYGFRVALVTKRGDECHQFPKGDPHSCGNTDSLAIKMSCVTEEKYPNHEFQNASLTKVTVTTISGNENVHCVARELVGYHQVDGKECGMENKSEMKPSIEKNKMILHDRGSLQCSNSGGEQKQCRLKVVSIDKDINELSKIEEIVDESEVSTYHSMELDPSDISICCDNPEASKFKEVNMVSSRTESKVEFISEKEHDKEKTNEHKNTKIFKTIDKPMNAPKSELQLKLKGEDESKENELENCDGQQNEWNKTLGCSRSCEKADQKNMADNKICQGDWGESNSLAQSIKNVESQANFVREIGSDSEGNKNNLCHQNAGVESIIDSRTDKILSESGSVIRDGECKKEKKGIL
mgnify:CR=1 FL=1